MKSILPGLLVILLVFGFLGAMFALDYYTKQDLHNLRDHAYKACMIR